METKNTFTSFTDSTTIINMGGWISMEQGTPAEQKRYLVYAKFNHHSSIHIAGYQGDGIWWSHGEKLNVTHWQPLPVIPII